jgi:hypothetical protein
VALNRVAQHQLDGEPTRTYRQGGNWVELAGAHCAHGEPETTAPAKLLVMFISNTGRQLKVDDPPQ